MAVKVKPRNTRKQMLEKLEELNIRKLLDQAQDPKKKS